MARRRNIYYRSLPNECGHRSKIATIFLQLILMFLLCFLSIDCVWPRVNNTCEQGHSKYGSNCEDEFQKILGDSIIVNNSTGNAIFFIT